MTDEEPSLPAVDHAQDGELLLYDYFKHLTTLALLALGGILTLSEIADREDVKPWLLAAVLITISLGGIAAFGGAGEIVRGRHTGTARHKSVGFYRRAAPILLAIGVGMFLSMFVDSIV